MKLFGIILMLGKDEQQTRGNLNLGGRTLRWLSGCFIGISSFTLSSLLTLSVEVYVGGFAS